MSPRLIRRVALLLLITMPVTLFGQTATIMAVDVTGLSGTYVLTVIGDQVSITPLRLIKPSPSPTPVPIPVPTLTQRGAAIRDAALLATADPKREATAQQLAALYGELARMLRDGSLKLALAADTARMGADRILANQDSTAAWMKMRALLSSQWVAVQQEGGTEAAFSKLLDEVQAGLNASAPQPQAIDIAFILMIIKLIIQILEQLRPQPTPKPVPLLQP